MHVFAYNAICNDILGGISKNIAVALTQIRAWKIVKSVEDMFKAVICVSESSL